MPKTNGYTILFFSFSVVLILLISSINIVISLNPPEEVVLGVSEDLLEQKNYWQNVLKENPTYFDGWVELSKIENRLGDNAQAEVATENAFQIKPNPQ